MIQWTFAIGWFVAGYIARPYLVELLVKARTNGKN